MIFLFRDIKSENPSKHFKVSLFLKTYLYHCLPTFSLKTYFIIACPLFSLKPIFRISLSHLSKFKIAGWRDGGGQAGGQAGWDHHQDREQSCVISNCKCRVKYIDNVLLCKCKIKIQLPEESVLWPSLTIQCSGTSCQSVLSEQNWPNWPKRV